jgi:hypothetical protein
LLLKKKVQFMVSMNADAVADANIAPPAPY